MDCLKLYAKNNDELNRFRKSDKHFNGDIGMEFGLDKSAKATFEGEKLVNKSIIKLDLYTIIKELKQEEV